MKTRSRKDALLLLFEICKDFKNVASIMLTVKHKDYPKAEIIIVPKDNFEKKAEYIKAVYDNDLTLSSCPDIKIKSVKVINNKGAIINE